MDYLHYTANEHRKGHHLTFECRVLIQTRLKDGWSPNSIAKEIGCALNTVRNEIKRGTMSLYKGNILRYKATVGQDAYERNRQSCCRHYDFFEKSNFISFVELKFFEEGWSLDACVGCALEDELFTEIRLSVHKHFMVTLISDFLESRTLIFRKNFADHLKSRRFIKTSEFSVGALRNVRHL